MKDFYQRNIQENLLKLDSLTSNEKAKIYELDNKPPTKWELLFLAFNYLFLILWSIIVIFPVVSLITSTFNIANRRYISLDLNNFKFGWENYAYLFTSDRSYYLKWYGNTILIAVSTMIVSTVFIALNGYAYSRFKFVGSKHSLTVAMMIQMIPATASLISLYLLVRLGNEKAGIPIRAMLIIIYSGGAISGNTFMLKSYLDTISQELDDSAKVDGCSNWGLFFRILIPVLKPGLVMIALWSFLTPFTDVILPKFVITQLDQQTLPVGLDSFINAEEKHKNLGAYAAGALLAALPAFALFMWLQRYIMGGLSEGAVKG